MVEIIQSIDALIEKSKIIQSKRRQAKVKLYCEGLKAKLEQVSFALSSVDGFSQRSDETVSTTEKNAPSIAIQVAFYCDAFWTFLYSSLDVLSQIVNQTMALGLKEKDVSFNQIKNKLGGNAYLNTEIYKKITKCYKSRAFKNLENYRNCSIHRRQIYIEEVCETKNIRRTAGYNSTATTNNATIVVTRTLCDNPLTQKPQIKQKRIIPAYMAETQTNIIKSIKEIVKAIEFKQ
ncbi:MAG TPA: Cthe_2314 family HEPN domain-containing protein [Anaerohalosphaeraceae bacterium]|nr:Cthe_2314 family HEPN domain-containing protein [Anaerohalosphaeraceae bacterium]HQG05018.1 Cthe_2314 family HEPN domain-containing protein [Anaerohalosphaeraceae bacterium]HQI07839.1 Cthe_2314 family HEPN domain-containing protein [Anaerohalosphaeraceae bacterium]HQJ68200.1 Cthe_2314 family HEPN domain-containing protein [Anaerohalosphaeraceae bacterium]